MKQNKSFKYRIYPNAEQKQLLAQTFGCARYVWNNLLDWRSKEYTLNGNKINYTKTSAKLTEIKTQEQFNWLNDVSSVALQQTLRSQDAADRYFVSFCSEVEIKSLPKVDKTVCVDLGLTDFVITSDGV